MNSLYKKCTVESGVPTESIIIYKTVYQRVMSLVSALLNMVDWVVAGFECLHSVLPQEDHVSGRSRRLRRRQDHSLIPRLAL